MKISNEKILKTINKLVEISQRQLPVKVSYAIAKNITKIENELKVNEKERQKLIDQYALKDEKGEIKADDKGQIIFKEDCKEKWDIDIQDLLNIENDIDFHKFKIEQLEGYSMTPAELIIIDYMIEE